MARFSKFYTAATGGLLTWGAVVVKSAPTDITSSEWLLLAGAAVTAIAVLVVRNEPA